MYTVKNVIFLFVLGLLFSGCFGKQPTMMELILTSDKELNQDENNISSPLMIAIFELESAEKFSKFSYWDITEDDAKKLDSDLLSQTKHIITPNQEQTYKILLNDKARFLGVIGKFYDISKPTWRYVINLDVFDDNEKELQIKNYAITSEDDAE